MSLNSKTLSAVDFLELAEMKRVARLDLSTAGFMGVVYVCDLTAAQQQEIFNTKGNRGKVRTYADQSYEVSISDMPKNSAAKFITSCLVTGAEGVDLDQMFIEAAEGDAEHAEELLVNETDLQFMAKVWKEKFSNERHMKDFINKLPNSVVNLIGDRVKQISGMEKAADSLEEKKGS